MWIRMASAKNNSLFMSRKKWIHWCDSRLKQLIGYDCAWNLQQHSIKQGWRVHYVIVLLIRISVEWISVFYGFFVTNKLVFVWTMVMVSYTLEEKKTPQLHFTPRPDPIEYLTFDEWMDSLYSATINKGSTILTIRQTRT